MHLILWWYQIAQTFKRFETYIDIFCVWEFTLSHKKIIAPVSKLRHFFRITWEFRRFVGLSSATSVDASAVSIQRLHFLCWFKRIAHVSFAVIIRSRNDGLHRKHQRYWQQMLILMPSAHETVINLLRSVFNFRFLSELFWTVTTEILNSSAMSVIRFWRSISSVIWTAVSRYHEDGVAPWFVILQTFTHFQFLWPIF